jgi:hypothetical protein
MLCGIIIPAGGLVGPDQQSEALNQPITARTVRIGATDVFGNLRRLGIAQHPDANRIDMNMTAGDAVEGVWLGARPAAQVEPPRDTLLFAVEVLEQGDEFVALDQEPGWIRHQQRADCFIARIVGAISNGIRLFRPGTKP